MQPSSSSSSCQSCQAWWLAHVAERAAYPRAAQGATPSSSQQPCSASTRKTVECREENHATGKWRRCREVEEVFRECADRTEQVSKREAETLELIEAASVSEAPSPAGPHSTEFGRALEEVFTLAQDLQHALNGMLPSGQGPEQPRQPGRAEDLLQPHGGGGGLLQRFFGKRPSGPKQQTKGDMALFEQFASGPSQEI